MQRDVAAVTEHSRTLTFSSSLDDIKNEYGRGVYIYFKFLRYIVLVTTVMSIPSPCLFSFLF